VDIHEWRMKHEGHRVEPLKLGMQSGVTMFLECIDCDEQIEIDCCDYKPSDWGR
jgi:hypothetical protein